ncbi:MAG: precorrin-8X methylmutase [bacterium]
MNKSLIHNFLAKPMSGTEIEKRSFEIIDAEMGQPKVPRDQWEVIRRMIHTCGDTSIAPLVRFSPHAIRAGVAALREGAPLYVDSNMIRGGLSLARLRSVNPAYTSERIICNVAAPDVAAESTRTGLPRSYFAVRKARGTLDGGIAVFGNAPVALLEINRMITEGELRPALVIGLPVGFVHVEESKTELLSLPVPYIVMTGRRGGSTLAVSIIHALCTVAGWTLETGE